MTSPPTQPSSQLISTSFVSTYFACLCSSPRYLYRLCVSFCCNELSLKSFDSYNNESTLTITPFEGAASDTVQTQAGIHTKLGSMGYENCSAAIVSVDSQYSADGSVLVLVTGTMNHCDSPTVDRRFVQAFLLAPQEKGYFVLNDVRICSVRNEITDLWL